jgi:hypothetical protein
VDYVHYFRYLTAETFDYTKKNTGVATNVIWSEGLISSKERIQVKHLHSLVFQEEKSWFSI